MGKHIPVSDRFWTKVAEDGDCWVWTACLDKTTGYGRFQIDGRTHYAHRVAYELMIADIPTGLHIDHKCRNRACVNPYHLDPVTSKVNTNRSPLNGAARTRCPQGHAYEGENLRVWTDKQGNPHRICVPCNIERAAAWRADRIASLAS